MKNRDVSSVGEYDKDIRKIAVEMSQYAYQCLRTARNEQCGIEELELLNRQILQKGESLKQLQEIIDSNIESSQSIIE